MRRNTILANPYIRAVYEVIAAHPEGITAEIIRREMEEPTETVLGTRTVEGALIRLNRAGHIRRVGKIGNYNVIWGPAR